MTPPRPGRWLLREPLFSAEARLLCFPYAGVGASVYHRWPQRLGPLEVCPVQLPGRENRMRERPFATFEEYAPAAVDGLLPYLDRPFAFFGHSMGARLAYAVLVELEARGLPVPAHLCVSSSLVPHAGFFGPFDPAMSDRQLVDGLRRITRSLGDAEPPPELLELAVRILRKDLEMGLRYLPPGPHRLPCPVTTIAWSDDPEVCAEELAAWHDYADVVEHVVPGDHFSFLTAPAPLQRAIEIDFLSATSGKGRS